jgi:wyosine [tRNA(Phe)-imidazoG37] synthetase (radical SAM superfamily)
MPNSTGCYNTLGMYGNSSGQLSKKQQVQEVSSVYGPVRSWRVGMSLGVDPICVNSVCSFNCTYCQLGLIQVRINERRLFVPTDKVMKDLQQSRWREADIITVSGSGEPTLASNLGDIVEGLKAHTRKPVLVLTNGTLLHVASVQEDLSLSDKVFVKLDGATEPTFRRINRPVPGVTLEGIISATEAFRGRYRGYLGIQMMFTRVNIGEVRQFAAILKRLRPDEVQLNTPTRPYPQGWVIQTRGSHDGVDYPARPLKRISREEAVAIETELRSLTGLNIISVYGE